MFEIYHPRTREANKKDIPAIKISKQSIVLNKKARNLIPATDKLELAYDKEAGTIRIKQAKETGGIGMKKTKVFAKGFLAHFGIDQIGKFPAEYREDEQALYVKVQ